MPTNLLAARMKELRRSRPLRAIRSWQAIAFWARSRSPAARATASKMMSSSSSGPFAITWPSLTSASACLRNSALATSARTNFLRRWPTNFAIPWPRFPAALRFSGLSAGSGESNARVQAMMGRQVEQLVRLDDDLLEVSRLPRGKILLRKEADRSPRSRHPRSAIDSSLPLIEKSHHALTAVSLASPQKVSIGGRPGSADAGLHEPAQQCRQVHRGARRN